MTGNDRGRGRHPAVWPTVFALPAFLVLVGLGTWQLDRLGWKERLIAERTAGLAVPLLTIDQAPRAGNDVPFRRIRLTGSFLHDKEILLESRTLNGQAGYHVVTPLGLTDGTTVLVDRGWVPRDRKEPASRAAGQIAGQTTIEGVLREPERPSPWTPDNDPQGDVWFYVDVPAVAAARGLEGVRPFYVEAGPAPNPGGLPVGGRTAVDLPNRHLEYALTWYALAAVLAVIYVLFVSRRVRRS